MQDLLFNAQLAYSAGRAYVFLKKNLMCIFACLLSQMLVACSFVFDNYTWSLDGTLYSDYNGKLIPSQIPLSALISGALHFGVAYADQTLSSWNFLSVSLQDQLSAVHSLKMTTSCGLCSGSTGTKYVQSQ